jgi:insecticidal toxin complex protein TccC
VSNYKYRRYSGKERDHSGLYYYGYRYYLPWLGRWLNPDPSGISQGLNLFEMVSNNPITYRDVDGKVFEYLKSWNTEQKISKGDISAIKGKGPFGLTMQSNIDLNFSFSRYDSQQNFEPILQKELTESQNSDVLFTALGHQVTSFIEESSFFSGTAWDKRPLSRETKIILLANGVQGAAGIKLDLNDIQANSTILITGGTLSGCTMITGVKDSIFYALHTGTATPTKKWKTGQEGVRDTMVLYNRLNPTFPVADTGDYSNSNLLDLLHSFDSGTLSYSGKSPFQIQGAANDARILNYSSTGLGVSFTLIRKNKEGVVSVQTLLEAGELSPTSKKKNSPTTTRNFLLPVHKYRAQTSVIHELL